MTEDRRIAHAKRLLEDEMLKEAFESATAKILAQIQTQPANPETALQLMLAAQGVYQGRREIERILEAHTLQQRLSQEPQGA